MSFENTDNLTAYTQFFLSQHFTLNDEMCKWIYLFRYLYTCNIQIQLHIECVESLIIRFNQKQNYFFYVFLFLYSVKYIGKNKLKLNNKLTNQTR